VKALEDQNGFLEGCWGTTRDIMTRGHNDGIYHGLQNSKLWPVV
jgi:hypothetical protein